MARISNVISNISVNVGAPFDIRPPAGEEWLIKDFGSSNAPVTGVPDISVAFNDATPTPCQTLIDPTTDPGKRLRQYNYYLTNAIFLTVTNTGAATPEISWLGEKVRAGLTVSAIAAIGAGGTIDIRPLAGITWNITEYGSDVWTAGPADVNPDVSIAITDGTLILSLIIDPTMARGQDKEIDWYISNAFYLQVTDTGGGGQNFAYCGRLVPETCISFVSDVAGSGIYDIRPANDAEWLITEFSAETWLGAAPAGYPDMTVSVMVGASLSNLLTNAGELRWDQKFHLNIDRTHWMRITETSTANNEIGFLGILKRIYN